MNDLTFQTILKLTKKADKLSVLARQDKKLAYDTLLYSIGIDKADALRNTASQKGSLL